MGEGEDFGQGGGIIKGVANELRRQRRNRKFCCHGSQAESTYANDLHCGSW